MERRAATNREFARGSECVATVIDSSIWVEFVRAGSPEPLRRQTKSLIDSPAKREGKDLLFMVCSDECGDALSSAMRKEWELADS